MRIAAAERMSEQVKGSCGRLVKRVKVVDDDAARQMKAVSDAVRKKLKSAAKRLGRRQDKQSKTQLRYAVEEAKYRRDGLMAAEDMLRQGDKVAATVAKSYAVAASQIIRQNLLAAAGGGN